jgi:hypothetical protein
MENKPTTIDKAVKLSIIAGALMLTLSIAYYLVIFLPNKEATRVELQGQEKQEAAEKKLASELQVKKEKCFIDAKKYHEAYIKSIEGYYREPKYSYNQELEKCLYSGGYNKSNDGPSFTDDKELAKTPEYYWERIVKDVYTNETILSAYNFQPLDRIEAYWEKYEEIMSQ